MKPPAVVNGRDRLGALVCRVPGCRHRIRAMTGFQEIERLRQHYLRAHLARLTMQQALELRAQWEAK